MEFIEDLLYDADAHDDHAACRAHLMRLCDQPKRSKIKQDKGLSRCYGDRHWLVRWRSQTVSTICYLEGLVLMEGPR